MGSELLDDIAGRVDRSIEQVADELVDASEAELDERVRALELLRRQVAAELAVTVAAAERHRVYLADGHRNMKGYLRATCNWSNAAVAAQLRLSKATDHVPGLAEALHTGHIGIPQAAAIARIHRNPRVRDRLVEFAPTLLDLAERLCFDDFHLALARFEMLADADGTHHNRDEPMGNRSVHITTVGGSVHLDATGGDPLVDVVTDARTWGLILADAGLIPRENLDGEPIDPFTGMPAESGHDLLRDLLADPAAFASMRCETSRGTPLHPHDVLRATLGGHVRRVIVDARNVPIDMGRTHRLFTGAAREATKLLVRRCDHAGCDLPEEFCDVDHITEWNDGGPTDQDNAGAGCNHHNRLKHKRRSATRRDIHGQRYTVRPDGSIILPVGARPPTFPSGPAEPSGTRDARDAIDTAELARLARARVRRLRRAA